MKVFGVGLFKTGTSSLGKALEILGVMPVTSGCWFVLTDSDGEFDVWYKDKKAWKNNYSEIKNKADKYNGFADSPWMFIYDKLDEWYPESKFILTVRKDSETLADSEVNFWKKNSKTEIPSRDKFIKRYEYHNKQVRDYFKDRDNFLEMCFECGGGWEKLCKFLDKPIPNVPFPHKNKGKYK